MRVLPDSYFVATANKAIQRLQRKIHLTLRMLDLPVDVNSDDANFSDPLGLFIEELLYRVNYSVEKALELQREVDSSFVHRSTAAALEEAHSSKRLAIIASIFLPLSLGTGILSI